MKPTKPRGKPLAEQKKHWRKPERVVKPYMVQGWLMVPTMVVVPGKDPKSAQAAAMKVKEWHRDESRHEYMKVAMTSVVPDETIDAVLEEMRKQEAEKEAADDAGSSEEG